MIQTTRLLMEQEELKGLVGGFCFGPLGILSMLRGVEQLFRDCVLYPSEVMAAMETLTDVLIEYVEAQCDAEYDCPPSCELLVGEGDPSSES